MAFMACATLAMTGCTNDDNAIKQPNVIEQQDETDYDDLECFSS